MLPLPPCKPLKNPLDLPEFRALVAQYLDLKDCCSCLRVSRDWFHDFAPSVWHTVDFTEDNSNYGEVAPEVLAKYGGFISQTVKITRLSDLEKLQHSAIKSLKLIGLVKYSYLYSATR
ncbi:hypothetical protein BGW39_007564 [Mortierella sp. 14UC]|nr:hypothetical protein BGW39_007564 [Mortierella sp. 14UC]